MAQNDNFCLSNALELGLTDPIELPQRLTATVGCGAGELNAFPYRTHVTPITAAPTMIHDPQRLSGTTPYRLLDCYGFSRALPPSVPALEGWRLGSRPAFLGSCHSSRADFWHSYPTDCAHPPRAADHNADPDDSYYTFHPVFPLLTMTISTNILLGRYTAFAFRLQITTKRTLD